MAKLGEITGKTRVLSSEMGEITVKTWVLPYGAVKKDRPHFHFHIFMILLDYFTMKPSFKNLNVILDRY